MSSTKVADFTYDEAVIYLGDTSVLSSGHDAIKDARGLREIRSDWRFVSFLQFQHAFKDNIRGIPSTNKEIEQAILHPDKSRTMGEIMWRLLYSKNREKIPLSKMKENNFNHWQRMLRERIQQKLDADKDTEAEHVENESEGYEVFANGNPMGTDAKPVRFENLSAHQRLALLEVAATWKLQESESMGSALRDPDKEECRKRARMAPLGFDADNRLYWYPNEDQYVFREQLSKKPKYKTEESDSDESSGESSDDDSDDKKGSQKKSANNKIAHEANSMSQFNKLEFDAEGAALETVSYNYESLLKLSTSLEKSKDENQMKLSKIIETDLLPRLSTVREKEMAAKEREDLLAAMPKKRSSRIQHTEILKEKAGYAEDLAREKEIEELERKKIEKEKRMEKERIAKEEREKKMKLLNDQRTEEEEVALQEEKLRERQERAEQARLKAEEDAKRKEAIEAEKQRKLEEYRQERALRRAQGLPSNHFQRKEQQEEEKRKKIEEQERKMLQDEEDKKQREIARKEKKKFNKTAAGMCSKSLECVDTEPLLHDVLQIQPEYFKGLISAQRKHVILRMHAMSYGVLEAQLEALQDSTDIDQYLHQLGSSKYKDLVAALEGFHKKQYDWRQTQLDRLLSRLDPQARTPYYQFHAVKESEHKQLYNTLKLQQDLQRNRASGPPRKKIKHAQPNGQMPGQMSMSLTQPRMATPMLNAITPMVVPLAPQVSSTFASLSSRSNAFGSLTGSRPMMAMSAFNTLQPGIIPQQVLSQSMATAAHVPLQISAPLQAFPTPLQAFPTPNVQPNVHTTQNGQLKEI